MKMIFNGSQIAMKLVDGGDAPLAPMTTTSTQTDNTGVERATSPMVPESAVEDIREIDESLFNTAMEAMAQWQPNVTGPVDAAVLEESQREETVATETDPAMTVSEA